jgi:hypothetical protein
LLAGSAYTASPALAQSGESGQHPDTRLDRQAGNQRWSTEILRYTDPRITTEVYASVVSCGPEHVKAIALHAMRKRMLTSPPDVQSVAKHLHDG